MKKIVIALLAALMVGSTFLTACGGETSSGVSQNASVSADALMRDIVSGIHDAERTLDVDVTVIPEYDAEMSKVYLYVDGEYCAFILADSNTVMFTTNMLNGEAAAEAFMTGVYGIVGAMSPSASEITILDICDGAFGVAYGGSYSKTVGSVTYFASVSDDGYNLNFIAS